VPDRRQQDVAPRLVRLGLEREPQPVPAVLDVLRQRVQALPVAVQRGPHVLGRLVLGALAPAPQHVGAGAQLGREVDVADHLAQRVAAHVAVVAGERAVLEHRVGEQVRGRHRHDEPGLVQRLAEPSDVVGPGRVVAAERDQVVVVEGDAVRAALGQPVHGLDRVQRGPGGIAERVAGGPAHRPQSERELVRFGRHGEIGHDTPPG
jgi:hypothetical protein